MKKNLFDVAAKDEMIKRSLQLRPDSLPAWGSMTTVEMLRHCSEAIYSTLNARQSDTPSTLKQRVAKFLMINIFK